MTPDPLPEGGSIRWTITLPDGRPLPDGVAFELDSRQYGVWRLPRRGTRKQRRNARQRRMQAHRKEARRIAGLLAAMPPDAPRWPYRVSP